STSESRFVCRDGAREIACLGELESSLQIRLRIVSERRHGGVHRITLGGPARTVLCVPLERALRFVRPTERAIRECERVVRGAPLGEECDGALQMRDGRVVLTFGRRDPSETELGGRFGRRL